MLGQQLADNVDSNLTAPGEFATTIHGAGTDLLNLINDILDHSKIESGTVTVQCEDLPFANLRDAVQRTFRHQTESGDPEFSVEFGTDLPERINTDPKRLLQVLKNLLANAFKFTEHGGVALRVGVAESGWTPGQAVLDNADTAVSFAVSDTGIGIALDKQKIVFEAFQQADAGTAPPRRHRARPRNQPRARAIARRRDQAPEHAGAAAHSPCTSPSPTPVPVLPELEPREARPIAALSPAAAAARPIPGRPSESLAGDCVMLIAEDDPDYARILVDAARRRGFRCLAASRGADALVLARKYRPHAVCLDINLPDMLGWAVLGQLKQDPLTRHAPVQILTGEDDPLPALSRGAYSYLTKPLGADQLDKAFEDVRKFLSNRKRRLLVVDPTGGADGMTALVAGGARWPRAKRPRSGCWPSHDCVVLAFEQHGRARSDRARARPRLRAVRVYAEINSARKISSAARHDAAQATLAHSGAVRREPILHRDVSRLPEAKLQMVLSLQEGDAVLADKKIRGRRRLQHSRCRAAERYHEGDTRRGPRCSSRHRIYRCCSTS